MADESSQAPEQPLTFEAALTELQQLTQRLEDGQESLEAALADFERGIGLLRTCYRLLEQAEQRIELFLGFDAEGQAVTTPFDASATLATNVPRVGKRRSNSAAKSDLPESPGTGSQDEET